MFLLYIASLLLIYFLIEIKEYEDSNVNVKELLLSVSREAYLVLQFAMQ